MNYYVIQYYYESGEVVDYLDMGSNRARAMDYAEQAKRDGYSCDVIEGTKILALKENE